MRLERGGGDIIIFMVPKQGPNLALVVDLDSLLLLRVGRGAGLEHEPIDSSEDQELPNKGHLSKYALCALNVVANNSLIQLMLMAPLGG